MATYDDQVATPQYQGESITFEDINERQQLLRRSDAAILEGWAFVGSSLQLRPMRDALTCTAAGTDLEVDIAAGTVLWRDSAPSVPGTDPHVFAGYFEPTAVTLDAADATNDRIDIITAKMEMVDAGSETRNVKNVSSGLVSGQSLDKARYARLTVTYTAGTPAGSPSEPSPPAGEEVIAVITVPATDTTVDNTNIEDRRMPAGARWVVLSPGDFEPDDIADWTFQGANTGTAPCRWQADAFPARLHAGVPAQEGMVIARCEFYSAQSDAAQSWGFNLIANDMLTHANVVFVADKDSAASTSDQKTTLDSRDDANLPYAVPADTNVSLRIDGPQTPTGDDEFFGARVLVY